MMNLLPAFLLLIYPPLISLFLAYADLSRLQTGIFIPL